jgi:dinuclear metal center YbgI/SA1388 family protein
MQATLADIQQQIETLAPINLAEEWDNVGLQVGQSDWVVKKIWVALDPAPDVVEAACRQKIDLLICHHPLILKPIKSIDFSRNPGSVVYMAARHHLAIYAAHTNLDSAQAGLNDIFAKRIGLKNLKPLMDAGANPSSEIVQGIGRIGDLDQPLVLKSLAETIKKCLSLARVRVVGPLDLKVSRVAVCTGSGSGLLGDFFASDAQVFVSGDIKYHDARDVEWARRGMIDVGHFASEHLVVEDLAERLSRRLKAADLNVTVTACTLENDPFQQV